MGVEFSVESGSPPAISGRRQTVAEYWSGRQNLIYYHYVEILAEHLSRGASSMIDVGSAGGALIGKFASVPNKTSLDLRYPYSGDGVVPVMSDFFEWKPDKKYDVVLCLQVLEHIQDAERFAQKLLSIGGTVIASVPYKWKHGNTKSHVHDPVDETKMLAWFGRKPNFSCICTEPRNGVRRLIHVYDDTGRQWHSLAYRDKILKGELRDACRSKGKGIRLRLKRLIQKLRVKRR